LIGSGAGAIGINRAIMCNAANLLFEKQLFTNCSLNNHLASGDDIFLMLYAKLIDREGIHFIKSRNAIVESESVKTVSSFFNQRKRWTSKSKAYRDFDIIFTAILVTIANTLLGIAIIYSFVRIDILDLIVLFSIKSVADFILLFSVTTFFKSRKLMFYFIPLQIIYPFYIIATVLFGLIGNFSWKGRKF